MPVEGWHATVALLGLFIDLEIVHQLARCPVRPRST
jgi:hypothetical protein